MRIENVGDGIAGRIAIRMLSVQVHGRENFLSPSSPAGRKLAHIEQTRGDVSTARFVNRGNFVSKNRTSSATSGNPAAWKGFGRSGDAGELRRRSDISQSSAASRFGRFGNDFSGHGFNLVGGVWTFIHRSPWRLQH